MPILSDLECIGKGIILSDRALRNTIHTVHLIGPKLSQAMPMDSVAILAILVGDMDDEFITPAGLEQRARIRAVKDLSQRFEIAVWRNRAHADIEMIFPSDTRWSEVFVIGSDVVLVDGVSLERIIEPAAAVLGRVAAFPANESGILACETSRGILRWKDYACSCRDELCTDLCWQLKRVLIDVMVKEMGIG